MAEASLPPAPRAGLLGSAIPPGKPGSGVAQKFPRSDRRDSWWVAPLSQAIGLAFLGAYATWAAFQGNHYAYTGEGRDYLSPFYSPLVNFGWWPLSPALLILWIPLGFRTTCYYYRKAYYRAFFADPAGCAVGELRRGYRGETAFPFILQNLHRYFMYLAAIFLIFLWADVVRGFIIGGRFGAGVGSFLLLANTTLLTLYTFSCHSLRHLVGGNVDCFSCAVAGGPRLKTWSWVSVLNEHHMGWAWLSLATVCSADFYVRMCSMNLIRDLRLF